MSTLIKKPVKIEIKMTDEIKAYQKEYQKLMYKNLNKAFRSKDKLMQFAITNDVDCNDGMSRADLVLEIAEQLTDREIEKRFTTISQQMKEVFQHIKPEDMKVVPKRMTATATFYSDEKKQSVTKKEIKRNNIPVITERDDEERKQEQAKKQIVKAEKPLPSGEGPMPTELPQLERQDGIQFDFLDEDDRHLLQAELNTPKSS